MYFLRFIFVTACYSFIYLVTITVFDGFSLLGDYNSKREVNVFTLIISPIFLAPILEELIFRQPLIHLLKKNSKRHLIIFATLFNIVVFSVMHLEAWWVALPHAFLLTYIAFRTKKLLMTIIFHSLLNATVIISDYVLSAFNAYEYLHTIPFSNQVVQFSLLVICLLTLAAGLAYFLRILLDQAVKDLNSFQSNFLNK